MTDGIDIKFPIFQVDIVSVAEQYFTSGIDDSNTCYDVRLNIISFYLTIPKRTMVHDSCLIKIIELFKRILQLVKTYYMLHYHPASASKHQNDIIILSIL